MRRFEETLPAMQTTETLVSMWIEARTRFSNQLDSLSPEDLKKKLSGVPNSAGFLIRHIGDVELLFAKNVFGDQEVKVVARTVIDKHDTGEWTDLPQLIEYTNASFTSLRSIVEKQSATDWERVITTREFGEKTLAQAFGRIVSHTTYHAGQLALIVKYGSAG